MTHFRLVLLSFLLLIPATVFGQNPDDLLDPENLNLPFLEHLVKLQIDSVRKAHGLHPLHNDSILYVAATDHSNWLKDNQTLGHFQKKGPKQTPSDRVKFYGGGPEYIVGENAISTFILRPTSSKAEKKKGETHIARTYRQAAFDMMNGWVHSPGHYANIITPDWNVTGVSISFDPKTKNLKGVQKFANKRFQYVFEEDEDLFPYAEGNYPPISYPQVVKKYPFRLKAPNLRHDIRFIRHAEGPGRWEREKLKKKIPRKTARDTLPGKDSIDFFSLSREVYQNGIPIGPSRCTIENGHLFFETMDGEFLAKQLKRRRDGLVAEFVEYDPYHPGNPFYELGMMRKNGNTLLTGTVNPPVYRRKIMRQIRMAKRDWKQKQRQKIQKTRRKGNLEKVEKKAEIKGLKAERFQAGMVSVDLGPVPDEMTGYFETNVLWLKQRRVTWATHFTNYCGEHWDRTDQFPLVSSLREGDYYPKPRKNELKFVVPFKKNETDYRERYVQPLMDSLVSESWLVVRAEIHGYASVEGAKHINERLQKERADAIVAVIEEAQKDSIEKEITAEENWTLFRKQLQKSRYKDWLDKSEAEIKALLQDSEWESRMEPMLRVQRRADVKLFTEENINEENLYDFALRDYRQALKESQKGDSLQKKWIVRAEEIQAFLFAGAEAGKLEWEEILEVELPEKGPYGRLWLNRMWLNWKNAQSEGKIFFSREHFNLMRRMARKESPTGLLNYNLAAMYMNAWGERRPRVGGFSPETLEQTFLELQMENFDSTLLNPLELQMHYKFIDYNERNGDWLGEWSSMFNLLRARERQGMNADTALQMAKHFLDHKSPGLAFAAVQPFAEAENPDHDCLTLYLILKFRHPEEFPYSTYYQELMDAKEVLSEEEWCNLFVGPCKISFQIFDHVELHDLWCKTCGERDNYATKPPPIPPKERRKRR